MVRAPRTEFAQALRAIASERKLDADVIIDTIKQAIVAAYKRDAREAGEEIEGFEYDVELDSSTGEARVFAWPEDKPEEKKDVTPPGFGRIAAQTAKQVIHQKIREAEKDAVMDEYADRVGSLISGMILRFDGPDVRVDMGRAEGIMPASERVPNERLAPNQRLTFLLKEIKEKPGGKLLILSRSDATFVQKLFEREVPEMSSGSVEVKAIAREPGVRTKMVVVSNQSGVDPVGSCVGQRGVRVQAVTNELGGERVDIIPFSENISDLVKASLSPAEGLTVSLKDEGKVANVKVPSDQLSLAIGKDGQNARLAAKLTGVRIEIEGLEDEEEEKDEGKSKKKKKKSTKSKERKADKEEVAKSAEKKEKKKTKARKTAKSAGKKSSDDNMGENVKVEKDKEKEKSKKKGKSESEKSTAKSPRKEKEKKKTKQQSSQRGKKALDEKGSKISGDKDEKKEDKKAKTDTKSK